MRMTPRQRDWVFFGHINVLAIKHRLQSVERKPSTGSSMRPHHNAHPAWRRLPHPQDRPCRIGVRQHHAMNSFLAQRVNRHGQHESCCPTSPAPRRSSSLHNQAQHASFPGFLLAFGKLGDFTWRNPPANFAARPFGECNDFLKTSAFAGRAFGQHSARKMRHRKPVASAAAPDRDKPWAAPFQ